MNLKVFSELLKTYIIIRSAIKLFKRAGFDTPQIILNLSQRNLSH